MTPKRTYHWGTHRNAWISFRVNRERKQKFMEAMKSLGITHSDWLEKLMDKVIAAAEIKPPQP